MGNFGSRASMVEMYSTPFLCRYCTIVKALSTSLEFVACSPYGTYAQALENPCGALPIFGCRHNPERLVEDGIALVAAERRAKLMILDDNVFCGICYPLDQVGPHPLE